MTWIDGSWMAMVAACATLSLIHFAVWTRARRELSHLVFACTGVAIAASGLFELGLMHAASPARYAQLLRWGHLAVAVLIPSMVLFVRLHLGAGRAWLGHLAWGTRVFAALVPNFFFGANLSFLEITALHPVEPWPGIVLMTPVGVVNPWLALAQLSNALLAAFLLDAAWTAWRRPHDPQRSRDIRICLSLAGFVLLAGAWQTSIGFFGLPLPIAIMPAFAGVLLVMSIELSGDVVRAVRLAGALGESQASLQRSLERIDDAVAAAGLGLWDWDARRDALWLSPRARDLLGIAGDAPVARDDIRRRIEPADLAALDAARAEAGQGEYGGEFRLLAPGDGGDDGPRWLLARARVENDAEGRPLNVRGVLVDVSERRQVAIQRDELAHLSRVATLTELSGSLAHELNQPLAAVLGNAQAALRYLEHSPPNLGEVRDCLVDIVDGDRRAGDVIARMQVMLRKEPLKFAAVDLNVIVDDVLRLVRTDLLERGVTPTLALRGDLPDASGDRVQLQQVLLNLIVNAAAAMQGNDGARRLTLRTAVAADGGVVLEVADRGPGIPPADLERIFAPFVTSKPDGLGIGLAVCRSIVAAHRGRLWATNNVDGPGATLHLWLPASRP
jgi:two-component system sensor kinase FixL